MERMKEWLIYHKQQVIIIGGIVLSTIIVLIIGIVFVCFEHKKEDEAVIRSSGEEMVTDSLKIDDTVTVDIKGAVNQAGVYQVSSSSHVMDVIELAKGVTENADTSVLNLGKKVFDEMVIVVYTKDQVQHFVEVKKEEEKKLESCIEIKEEIKNDACISVSPTPKNSESKEDSKTESPNLETSKGQDNENALVSLNKGTIEELMTLKGIGEAKAKLIINYRNEHGSFQTIEELMNVKGIGDSTFAKIKDRLTI